MYGIGLVDLLAGGDGGIGLAGAGICLGVALTGWLLGGAIEDQRPVHVVEIDRHRLSVHRRGKLRFEVTLDELEGVQVEEGMLCIRHSNGVHRIDGRGHADQSIEEIARAFTAAWTSQRRVETPEAEAERKRSLARLAKLRQRA